MAAAAKLLFAVLLFCVLVEGKSEQCELSSVQIQTTNTGVKVGFDFVFEVEVKNLCHCTLSDVYLKSGGFTSSMPVDPKAFRRAGVGYLVNDGKGIPSSLSVKFRYAWDHYFRMAPASLKVDCRRSST